MKAPLDLAGKKFGRLTAISLSVPGLARERQWFCRCDCGVEKNVKERGLREGGSRSCGCAQIEHARSFNRKHGLYESRLYKSWEAMKTRCFNPNNPAVEHYSGRGITCCDFLSLSATNLKSVIGDRPEGMSLDRIDFNGHYSCGSCPHCIGQGWPLNIRWLTQHDQTRNTRKNVFITIGSLRKCIADWASHYGVTVHEFKKRLASGLLNPQ